MSEESVAHSLLRLIVPSWSFFDRLESLPELWDGAIPLETLRNSSASELRKNSVSLLFPQHPKRRRSFRDVFWNPGGNLRLRTGSLIERFLDEIQESHSSSHASSEHLVSPFAQAQLPPHRAELFLEILEDLSALHSFPGLTPESQQPVFTQIQSYWLLDRDVRSAELLFCAKITMQSDSLELQILDGRHFRSDARSN